MFNFLVLTSIFPFKEKFKLNIYSYWNYLSSSDADKGIQQYSLTTTHDNQLSFQNLQAGYYYYLQIVYHVTLMSSLHNKSVGHSEQQRERILLGSAEVSHQPRQKEKMTVEQTMVFLFLRSFPCLLNSSLAQHFREIQLSLLVQYSSCPKFPILVGLEIFSTWLILGLVRQQIVTF